MRFLAFALLAGLAACRHLLPRQVSSVPPPQAFNSPSPGVPRPISMLYDTDGPNGTITNLFLACRTVSRCVYSILWEKGPGNFGGGNYQYLIWRHATAGECENSRSSLILKYGHKYLLSIANGTLQIDFEADSGDNNASLVNATTNTLEFSKAAATNTNTTYLQHRCKDNYLAEPLDPGQSFEKIWDI
jgi:hypothetical protein